MSTELEINVTATPAVIDTNYEVLKAAIQKEMERYDIVVTQDTVKGAKKSAADLNKLKASLAERRKLEIENASAPVKEFDAKFRELEQICNDARERIVEQTKAFEAETLKKAQGSIDEELQSQYEERGVRSEYRDGEVNALLTHLTAKGSLSSAGLKAIDAVVSDRLAAQQRKDLRVANLELACHRAGLKTPLTEEYISGFVDTPSDDDYARMLDDLINMEVSRQKRAEELDEQKREQERIAEEHRKAKEEAEREKAAEWDKQAAQSLQDRFQREEAEADAAPKEEIDKAAGYPVGEQEERKVASWAECLPDPAADDLGPLESYEGLAPENDEGDDLHVSVGEYEAVETVTPPGQGKIHIVCTLETDRPEGMTDDEIIAYTRNRLLNEAGITTLKTIEIRSV